MARSDDAATFPHARQHPSTSQAHFYIAPHHLFGATPVPDLGFAVEMPSLDSAIEIAGRIHRNPL